MTTRGLEAPTDRGAEVTGRSIGLVPRLRDQGYDSEQMARRRAWVEERTGARLDHVGRHSIPSEDWRGNIENPVGAVQMPLGVAGPLRVRGEIADGIFYVPLATTEGALVRSYERGAVAITRSGGATVRVVIDENRVGPVIFCRDLEAAARLAARLPQLEPGLRSAAEATTRHGRLLRVTPLVSGRQVILDFSWSTGDAQGMNMAVRGTDAACRWLCEAAPEAERYYIFSGYNGEKRAAGSLLRGGKGKTVVATARLPAPVVQSVLHATPAALVDMWHHTVVGHLRTGALGYNGHLANGLTAIFIATGQDVANVVNSATGITNFEVTADGALHAAVTLTSLSVATVGGGTRLGTSRECLEMLGCVGDAAAELRVGEASRKLAEIVAAALLGGELSMGAAIASGELVAAHEAYGRNRPDAAPDAARGIEGHDVEANEGAA